MFEKSSLNYTVDWATTLEMLHCIKTMARTMAYSDFGSNERIFYCSDICAMVCWDILLSRGENDVFSRDFHFRNLRFLNLLGGGKVGPSGGTNYKNENPLFFDFRRFSFCTGTKQEKTKELSK